MCGLSSNYFCTPLLFNNKAKEKQTLFCFAYFIFNLLLLVTRKKKITKFKWAKPQVNKI